jgi:hypothetical protein
LQYGFHPRYCHIFVCHEQPAQVLSIFLRLTQKRFRVPFLKPLDGLVDCLIPQQSLVMGPADLGDFIAESVAGFGGYKQGRFIHWLSDP